MQFIYQMPVAVVKLDTAGAAQMLNPMAVQLLGSLHVIDTAASSGVAIMEALSPGPSRG